MRKLTKQTAAFVLLLLLTFSVTSSIYAAGTDVAITTKTNFNMEIAYGITSAAALLLAIGYWGLVKNKNRWLLLLFVSVVIVNLGYFSLAISKTLDEALLANRISYLGSVFLPLCMLMTIMDACKMRYSKKLTVALLCISIIVFLIAASPGYLDCYYSDVSLVFINGMAKLEKVYGPLHNIYLVYLLSYMGLMAGTILTSRVKRKTVSQKHAVLLMIVTFLNISIWFVEQLIYTQFEFLSVSYIASELLLLVLYGMMQDYGIILDGEKQIIVATVVEERSSESVVPAEANADPDEEIHSVLDEERILYLVEKWRQEYALTNREAQVLVALLQNKRRKEIAVDMDVTEHTVKKHTGNIFSKLEVTSRAELFALADQE